MANSAFLLGRLGFTFKAKAIAEVEAVGFSLYDYSVLALLAEGASETSWSGSSIHSRTAGWSSASATRATAAGIWSA